MDQEPLFSLVLGLVPPWLVGRVPRVKCPEHCVHQVPVPWARAHDNRIWRVIDPYVTQAGQRVDMAGVYAVGLDETGNRRGHDTITLFVDLPAKGLLFATADTDARTVQKGFFAERPGERPHPLCRTEGTRKSRGSTKEFFQCL